MTLGDLLGNANAETPIVVIVAGVLIAAAGWIGGRAFRSVRRQGARVGAVERKVSLEQTRRRQVEQLLRELRVPLPYWPDDPAELYAPYSGPGPWPEDGVPLPDDLEPVTRATPTIPPLPDMGRHRRAPARNQGDY